MKPLPNPRVPDAEVDPQFVDRWSPRSYLDEPIPQAHLDTLFEAVRWAPSCSNEQPWRIHYAVTADARARLLATLDEGNQVWARRAPLLLFMVAARRFARSGKPNDWAVFDTGAAWMSLALQARRLGYHTHAMAGFDRDRAYEALGLDPEEHAVICAVALGRRGPPDVLPERSAAREHPNGRRSASEIVVEVTPDATRR